MIKAKNLVELPEGKHDGIIIRSEIGSRDFKQGDGLQPVLFVGIQPRNSEDGDYPELELTFRPVLNPMSALGKFLKALGVEVDYSGGESWDEKSIIGTEVTFTSVHKPVNGINFSQIVRESIRKL